MYHPAPSRTAAIGALIDPMLPCRLTPFAKRSAIGTAVVALVLYVAWLAGAVL
jgi:hypothetical protein